MLNFNNSKLLDRYFRKVDGVVWDLITGKIGVQSQDGIATIEGVGDDAQIVINPVEQFGMAVPAFAQSTSLSSVAPGDIVCSSSKILGWVTEVKPKTLVIMTANGTRTTFTPPKIQVFGLDSGVLVLRSLFNILPGGLASAHSMLMPLMMMAGEEGIGDISPMLMMMAMGGNNGATPDQTSNLLQTMMMMKMLSGSSNPKVKASSSFFHVR